MAASTLQDVVDQLLENKKSTDKTTDSMSKVADLLTKQIKDNRITAENNAKNQIEASRNSGSRSVVGEVVATGGNAIAGSAGGLIGLGAGIAGFMAALSVGSMGLDWLGNDYSGLGEAFAAFSGAVSQLTPAGVLALGAITTAAIGAGVFRVNGLQIAGNMAGLGAGISAFMGALALGEIGISWINAIPAGSSKGLVATFGIFNDAVMALSAESILALGAIITAGAALGAIPGGPVMVAAGMAGIGAGISAFMAALAFGEVGIGWINAIPSGSSKGLVSTFQLFNDAIMALSPDAMKALGVLMLAAPAGALVSTGLPLIGVGIAGFMTAIAVSDGITKLISMGGEPGAGLRSLFTNIFTGIASANQLKDVDLVGLGAGLESVASGLAAFGVGSIISGLGQAVNSIVSFFAGESAFDQIMNLADKAPGLTAAGQALEVIAGALGKFGEIQFDASNVDFKGMAEQLGYAIPTLQALATGGKLGEGWFDGPAVDFGNGILDPTLRLDEMAAAIAKVNYILGQTTTYPIDIQGGATPSGSTTSGATTSGAVQPAPSTSGAALSAAQSATQSMIYNAPVYNYITNNNGGGGGTSIMTVPVDTRDTHDYRDRMSRYAR
jgi:hypothetical protein